MNNLKKLKAADGNNIAVVDLVFKKYRGDIISLSEEVEKAYKRDGNMENAIAPIFVMGYNAGRNDEREVKN